MWFLHFRRHLKRKVIQQRRPQDHYHFYSDYLFTQSNLQQLHIQGMFLTFSYRTLHDMGIYLDNWTFLMCIKFYQKYCSFPHTSNDSNFSRPNELLLPVKELDSTITDEATSGTLSSNGNLFILLLLWSNIIANMYHLWIKYRGSEFAGEIIASPIPDEQWFEAPVTENDFRPPALKSSRMSTTQSEYVEAESVRDATIRELEEFLVEFRNGKLRTRILIQYI